MNLAHIIRHGLTLVAVSFVAAACTTSSTSDVSPAKSGSFYAVSSEKTPFYRYGPQQGSGPDQQLSRDTIMTLIRPSFGYCKVQLLGGEQGYVAAEDIKPASHELIAAATAPPPAAVAESPRHKFRLDSIDPRLLPPPEPLPLDLPEPTPIPGTEASPSLSPSPIVP
jgi:hypothetical protein